MIDLSTIQSMELIQNVQHAKSKDCLFGLLNETLTPMGARMLRSFILQPSTQADVLNQRYDAVEELIIKEDMFHRTRKGISSDTHSLLDTDLTVTALKPFQDIEKLLTSVCLRIELLTSLLIFIAHSCSQETRHTPQRAVHQPYPHAEELRPVDYCSFQCTYKL